MKKPIEKKREYYGLVSPAVTCLSKKCSWSRCLTRLICGCVSKCCLCNIVGYVSAERKLRSTGRAQRAAATTDLAILIKIAIAIALLLFVASMAANGSAWRNVGWLAILLILDTIANVTRVALVFPPGDFKDDVRIVYDPTRVVLLGLVNYVELIIYFAMVYATSMNLLQMTDSHGSHQARSMWDALYFSAITQLTIGYGDMHPEGWLRLCACIQGLTGVIVLVLLISQFVNSLPRSVGIAQYHREQKHKESLNELQSKEGR